MRISSLSALTAAALSPVFVLLLKGFTPEVSPRPYLILSAFMAVLVFIRHHENIRRLLKGEEPKIGKKKTPAA
jgi:glycerol-3-phosphate acyltransferase PlsY